MNKVNIYVSVPGNYIENVRKAVCDAGAGTIGNYTCCTSTTKSTGTFKPNDNAHPFIGSKNTLEYVEEETLEFVCDVDKVKNLLKELRKAHPYEEPAINIVPLIEENQFE